MVEKGRERFTPKVFTTARARSQSQELGIQSVSPTLVTNPSIWTITWCLPKHALPVLAVRYSAQGRLQVACYLLYQMPTTISNNVLISVSTPPLPHWAISSPAISPSLQDYLLESLSPKLFSCPSSQSSILGHTHHLPLSSLGFARLLGNKPHPLWVWPTNAFLYSLVFLNCTHYWHPSCLGPL